jgi:phosphatidylserine/phosphatidylglycerophosphate/cardiolipin synthase-like enzyme
MHDVLLITDDNYLPALMMLLEKAKTNVDVVAFSFAIGVEGKRRAASAPAKIADKLIALKNKGLNIRLFLEGYRETAERNRVTAEYLKKAGIDVKYGSTHAKGFCIDKKYLLFGSTNLTNQSIQKNFETNVLLRDLDAIEGFEIYFEHLWKGGKHGGIKLPPPMVADGGFKDVIIQMIDSAQKTLEFSIYFFHLSEIERAMIRAFDRGVKVTGVFHHHSHFALSYVHRTKATAERMREAGITNLHYGPGNLFTHSKFLIRDRKEVALGTGNWLHEDVKIHPQLYIHLKSPKFARELARHLEKTITKFGE